MRPLSFLGPYPMFLVLLWSTKPVAEFYFGGRAWKARFRPLAGCLAGWMLALLWPITGFAQDDAMAAPEVRGAEAALEWSAHEQALLRLANDYRAYRSLARWTADDGLRMLARSASLAMARAGRASHEGFADRFHRSGSRICVENIARGRMSPETAMVLWQRSPSHHVNLVEPRVYRVGFAEVDGYVTMFACGDARR